MNKFLRFSAIPYEIWAAACDYEGIERGPDISKAVECYALGIDDQGRNNGGLDRAIAEYLLRDGPFADGAEFAHVSGYVLSLENR